MRSALLCLLTAAMAFSQAPAAAPAKPDAAKPKPAGASAAAAKPASKSIPAYQQLKYPPLGQVKIPDVPTVELPNGIKLYMLENHELPLVSGFALIRTGNLFDPPDKIGLATTTGGTMRTGGTKSKTGEQLDEELESIAASVESNIGETSGTVSFSTLKEHTDKVLAIWKDVLTQPEFRQDKIDLLKNQLRGGIARRNDDASGIASREFRDIVYGKNTPYGWDMEYKHVDNIKREDLIGFYRRYFFPANTRIAIYGDFNASEMKAKLEKLFADWTEKQAEVPPFPPVDKTPRPGVNLAVKNDVNQTFFQMGHLGGMLKDKDYPALEVMADILGGGFSSRLFRRVRTQLGYAYSIGAGWGANYNHPGLFRVSGSTKSQNTVDAIQAAQEEVAKIRDSEVTDQELQTSKSSVLNSFVFNFDHPTKTLNRIVQYEYQGYPRDFIFQYQKGIESVTKADVLRVAKDYIKPPQMTIVAVGKPSDFGKPLSTFGPVKEIDLSDKKEETAKADEASIAKGKNLLQRAQQAMGGVDKLSALKDATMSADIEVNTGQGTIKIAQTNLIVEPGIIRQVQDLPFGKMTTFYDGKTGWMHVPQQGKQPMPPNVMQQARGQVFRGQHRLIQSDRNPDRTVNAISDTVVEISDKQGNAAKVEVDPATGLPSKTRYTAVTQQGPTETVETYSDWRDVNGIKVPFKVVIEQGGRKFADVTVREVKYNTGLKVEDLSKEP